MGITADAVRLTVGRPSSAVLPLMWRSHQVLEVAVLPQRSLGEHGSFFRSHHQTDDTMGMSEQKEAAPEDTHLQRRDWVLEPAELLSLEQALAWCGRRIAADLALRGTAAGDVGAP
jgi:hypothetical protein